MAGRKLAANVHVGGRFFEAGSTPEKEFADQITNPKAWGEDEAAEAASDGPPPKAGRGSGKEAWAAYAEAKDVEFDADASRDEIIAAVEAAGVPTE